MVLPGIAFIQEHHLSSLPSVERTNGLAIAVALRKKRNSGGLSVTALSCAAAAAAAAARGPLN